MKSFYYYAASVVACLFMATSSLAQRVKPELPEPATIEEGKYYYLYNEDAGVFAHDDGSRLRPTSVPNNAVRFTLDASTGYYYIDYPVTDGSYTRWAGYESDLYTRLGRYTYTFSENKFRLKQDSDKFYTIQRDYMYIETEYIGYNKGEDRFYTNRTENIRWRLIPAKMDYTRHVTTDGWEGSWADTQYAPSVTTSDGRTVQMMEKYSNSMPTTTGTILSKKVTGLANGTYTVVLYANAFFTPDRGFESTLVDGATDAAYVFAGDNKTYIKAQIATSTPQNGEYTIENVEVTDNTLAIGLGIDKTETNWHTIQIKELRYVSENFDEEELAVARHILYSALESVDSIYCVAPFDEILNTSTDKNELLAAARDVMHGNDITNKYNKHDDSYPIWFYSLQDEHGYRWGMESDNEGFTSPSINGQAKCLKAIVNVEEDAALLSYWLDATNHNPADVYIDGAHVKNIPAYQSNQSDRYFEYLNKGVHVIEWRVYDNTSTTYDNCAIRTIKVEKIPEQISINLVEPGSLGSEILSFVDRVTDATSLKIKGRMNSDDWSTLKLITGLRSIDLSEAEITEIQENQFNEFKELYEVILPEGLKIIGKWAFRGTPLDEILLPSTLESIGQGAFAHSNISEIIIPDNVTDIKHEVFYECFALKKVTYSKSVIYIPNHCFFRCYHLESFDFHEGLESIGGNAFEDCYSLGCNAKLPESMKSIGYRSFMYAAIDSLFIPEGVGISDDAFIYSTLRYAELPTTYYDCSNRMFVGCSNLKTIKFKSPTKVTYQYNKIIDDGYRANITLLVPDFLVSAYKLDSYWYNYGNIEGFPTTEISEWTINNPLVLDANSRFQGSPDIYLNNTSFTMNGETGMEVNEFRMNLTASNWWADSYPYSYYSSSQVLVSADVDIKSLLELDYQTYGNRWYFISLPFDIKVSDIKTDAQYAIRYYDGANRAQTGAASGNWKNYSADDIVPAGTGFAFQTSKDAWNTFVAYENVNKNRAFKAKDLSAALDENLSETSEHRGWNFVGNPWMTFYNIHSVDFTAPITVYNHDNGTYKAYSIIDDDVALHPTQAFFVQCPEDVSVITFPARGRQLTKDITNQNGGKLRGADAVRRNLVDVELLSGDASDKTRVVFNEEATLGYDYGADASKFFAESNSVQLYTVDNDECAYSINERPSDNGYVNLAYIVPSSGEYTISLTRNQMGTVILKDMQTGRETDITLNDYTFSSEAGTFTDRFRLTLFPIDVTGVDGTRNDKPEIKAVEGGINASEYVRVFTIDGRMIAEGEGSICLGKGTYVVRAKNESVKVVVK